jgi:hypothetical protein
MIAIQQKTSTLEGDKTSPNPPKGEDSIQWRTGIYKPI